MKRLSPLAASLPPHSSGPPAARGSDGAPRDGEPGSRPGPATAQRTMRLGRGGSPRPIAESLGGVIEGLGLGPALEDARVFADWESVVGPEIARISQPYRVDYGTLIVHVKNSAWMSELALRRSDILRRVNAGRRRRKFTRLIFRIED